MSIEDENDEVFDADDLAEGFDEETISEDEGDPDEVEDLDDEIVVDGDVVVVDDDSEDVDAEEGGEAPVSAEAADDDDDLDNDADVELALDEVLAETILRTTVIDDDDDGPIDTEALVDPFESILPKQDDEFRCSSCRLLKKQSQLADPAKNLCRDCV